MGTAVADLNGVPEVLAPHHQSGVEELTNIFVDRWHSLYRIAIRQLENGQTPRMPFRKPFCLLIRIWTGSRDKLGCPPG
jgi:hypothetical protein